MRGRRLIPSQTAAPPTGRLLLFKRTGASRARLRELMRYRIACSRAVHVVPMAPSTTVPARPRHVAWGASPKGS